MPAKYQQPQIHQNLTNISENHLTIASKSKTAQQI